MSKLDRILYYFPEETLPVFISEDRLESYEGAQQPLPQAFVDEVLVEWEKEVDEFTEFLACFSLPKTENYHTIVYWKSGLLKYEFILVTLSLKGDMLYKKSIAGTTVQNNIIRKSVASIEPDHIIHIVAGQSIDGEVYDASLSKSFTMEILPDGEIIFNREDI